MVVRHSLASRFTLQFSLAHLVLSSHAPTGSRTSSLSFTCTPPHTFTPLARHVSIASWSITADRSAPNRLSGGLGGRGVGVAQCGCLAYCSWSLGMPGSFFYKRIRCCQKKLKKSIAPKPTQVGLDTIPLQPYYEQGWVQEFSRLRVG